MKTPRTKPPAAPAASQAQDLAAAAVAMGLVLDRVLVEQAEYDRVAASGDNTAIERFELDVWDPLQVELRRVYCAFFDAPKAARCEGVVVAGRLYALNGPAIVEQADMYPELTTCIILANVEGLGADDGA